MWRVSESLNLSRDRSTALMTLLSSSGNARSRCAATISSVIGRTSG